MINKEELIFSLYQIGTLQFGEFTLKSGQSSTVYINLRKIISYPYLLKMVAKAMWEATANCDYDLVCGVPYTALPIATCLSLDHDISMIMSRKEKKDYGTKQMIEGAFAPGQRCLIIEDVITTGGSIIETAEKIEEVGLNVTDVVALIDREQGGVENLNVKYQTHTILTISEILNTLLSSNQLKPEERPFIEQFLKSS